MTWPFSDLEPRHYAAIVADPPWRFESWSAKGDGRNANQHYPCMSLADLREMPVRDLAARDACLFMWAIDSMLPQALGVMEAWGFTYKTVGFTWAKTTKDGSGFPIGTGYWTRANTEVCLLGTIGSPKRLSRAVRKLIIAPRREHSQKPPEVLERVEQLVGGPYLELFARTSTRTGWDFWGNEREKFNVRGSDPAADRSGVAAAA